MRQCQMVGCGWHPGGGSADARYVPDNSRAGSAINR
jgi:hypothetical protein